MLGVIENRQPVTGEFINIVRDSLKRAFTGNLNKKEQQCRLREIEAEHQYNVIWK